MRPARRQFSTTVHALLDARTARLPSKDICRFEAQDVRWTLTDLRKHSRAFAGGMLAAGFRPASSVVLLLPNNLERLVFMLAAAQAQAIVGVFAATPTPEALRAALEHSGARAVVAAPSTVGLVRKAVPELALEVAGEGANEGRPLVSLALPNLRRAWHTGNGKEPMVTRVRDMLLYNPLGGDPVDRLGGSPDAPYFAMYSSTGAVDPKSLATQAQMVQKAQDVARTKLRLSPEDRLLLNSAGNPHTALLAALACVDSCAQLIVPADPNKIDNLCLVEGVTHVFGELPQPKKLGARSL
jgi:acyl-CoA synthetase (AMP-forming)/AMP-acid ligase II